jgi:chemotaxis protein MotB
LSRKRKKIESGGSNWLDTYADMVTLLLTFFILLYSMSTIDSAKYYAIVEAFSKGNVAVTQEDLPPGDEMLDNGSVKETITEVDEDEDNVDELYTLLMEYVNENNLTESVEVTKSEEYVFIRFYDNITFNGYSNQLKDSGKEILDVLAQGLGLVNEYIEEVIIAGHTAEVEKDTSTIDRNLSTERANAVLQYLEAKNVIDPAMYLAIGYGLYSPIADNSTAEGRAKNRRVEIYISRKGYPVSYTHIIDKTINGEENSNKNISNDSINNNADNPSNIEYKSNKVIKQ